MPGIPAPRTLTTQRLAGEAVGPGHVDFLQRLWQDPRATATLGGPRPPEVVAGLVGRWAMAWERVEYGVWVFHERMSGDEVGYCGLAPWPPGGPGAVEMLYALVPHYWRKGYATEMARATLDVARAAGLAEVHAFTLHDNVGSQGVMKAAGMTYVGDITHAGLPHVLYLVRLSPVQGS